MGNFKQYILANYDKDQLGDISKHGCVSGCTEWIYYKDTVEAYNLYTDEIWDRLYRESKEFCFDSILEFIASFNGSRDVGGEEQFKNLLVWWFVESVAYEFLNKDEDN